MNQVIADTVSFLSKSIDPRIVMETRPDPDLPLVEADAGQMQQVLVNVAVNAAEAMPEGGRITFETRVAHLDQGHAPARPDLETGDYVEVVIGDTGAGIPPEVADRVFEPFFTTKTDGDATGLGLSVVYGIVKNHRGTLELDIEEEIPDSNAVIITHCGGGGRSALAAESLQKMGYKNVRSMAGGFKAWKAAGLPTAK